MGGQWEGFVGKSHSSQKEYEWMASLTPKNGVFVEVGSYHGVSAAWLAQKRPDLLIICVDPFPPKTDEYDESGDINLWIQNKQETMRLFVGSLKEFWHIAKRGIADTIFIDGDHRYDPVMADLHDALRVCTPDGRIFCHDYSRPRDEDVSDVARAVNDFCKTLSFKIEKQTWSTVLIDRSV